MKKLFVGCMLAITLISIQALIPATAHPHENNGKKIEVDGEAIACGGQGDQCYWQVPQTVGPGGN